MDAVCCCEKGDEEELKGAKGCVCSGEQSGCCARGEDGCPEVGKEVGHDGIML